MLSTGSNRADIVKTKGTETLMLYGGKRANGARTSKKNTKKKYVD